MEEIFGVGRSEICGKVKSARIVEAKEAVIVSGRRLGASVADLARLTGLNSSTVRRAMLQFSYYPPHAKLQFPTLDLIIHPGKIRWQEKPVSRPALTAQPSVAAATPPPLKQTPTKLGKSDKEN